MAKSKKPGLIRALCLAPLIDYCQLFGSGGGLRESNCEVVTKWRMGNGELGTHNRVGSETGSSLIVNSQFPAKGGFASAKEMADRSAKETADRSGGDEPTSDLPLKPTIG